MRKINPEMIKVLEIITSPSKPEKQILIVSKDWIKHILKLIKKQNSIILNS